MFMFQRVLRITALPARRSLVDSAMLRAISSMPTPKEVTFFTSLSLLVAVFYEVRTTAVEAFTLFGMYH